MSPSRVQRQRSKGFRMPENTVYVGRPSRWGNPLRPGMWKGYSAQDAVNDYLRWLKRDPAVRSFDNAFGKPPTCKEITTALKGRNLACWCALDAPCHADILLGIANGLDAPAASQPVICEAL